MKTWSVLIRVVVISGLAFFSVGSASAQYLPPMLNGAIPYQIAAEPGAAESVYVESETPAPTDARTVIPAQEVNILITPIAGPVNTTVKGPDSKGAEPQSESEKDTSDMVPYTIYYFPPPTFPDPIPLTVYKPAAPQSPYGQVPGGQMAPMMQQPGNNSLLYAPPMVVQPHYFGPAPEQPYYGSVHGQGHGGRPLAQKMREKKLQKQRALGNPGEPVVGPPTLVYPNGIVVRPKVYLPNQPCKNIFRGMMP